MMKEKLTGKGTNMLSWGFATEGVCVRAGGLMLRKRKINNFTGSRFFMVWNTGYSCTVQKVMFS
jgi:hypothetical protein